MSKPLFREMRPLRAAVSPGGKWKLHNRAQVPEDPTDLPALVLFLPDLRPKDRLLQGNIWKPVFDERSYFVEKLEKLNTFFSKKS
ncbi:MAG: hypothetical protein ACI4O5_05485 [Oscillospiraceae bacterium]